MAFYTAWVDKQHQSKVYDILYPFSATRVMEIEPAEGEVRPTALKNKALLGLLR
ncbi:MAG: hypothetical protein U5N58_02960 [Actinomycetota bacterium]|nr:hypothetical protein [Actinomycetota bacterium]